MEKEIERFAGTRDFRCCMECKLEMSAALKHKKKRSKFKAVLETIVVRPWDLNEEVFHPEHAQFHARLLEFGTDEELFDFPVYWWMRPEVAKGYIKEGWHLSSHGNTTSKSIK